MSRAVIGIDHRRTRSALAIMEESGPRLLGTSSGIWNDGARLRDLLGAHATQLQEISRAPVIAVQASIDQGAIEAIRRAAQSAGLERPLLLQAPLAAALAYSFHMPKAARAFWLVLDWDEAVLDVALISVRDGILSVLKDGIAGDPAPDGFEFSRAINLCRQLFARNRLGPDDIRRFIFAGKMVGSGGEPQALAEYFGIPLEVTIDPEAAVALGAAIYAVGQELVCSSTAEFSIVHESTSREPSAPVAIRGVDPRAVYCELERERGLCVGRIDLRADQETMIEVALEPAERPHENRFVTKLLDASDRELARIDGPRIWHPYPTVTGRSMNSLRISSGENRTQTLIQAGASLPATGAIKLSPTLQLSLLQGRSTLLGDEADGADSCLEIGTINLGSIVPGSIVDLVFELDSSRYLTVRAYSSESDEELAGCTLQFEPTHASVDEIERRLRRLREDLASIETVQAQRPDPQVEEALAIIRELEAFTALDRSLGRARYGDEEARIRADARMRELAGTLNTLGRRQVRARCELRIEQIRMSIGSAQTDKLHELLTDLGAAVTLEALEEVEARISLFERSLYNGK